MLQYTTNTSFTADNKINWHEMPQTFASGIGWNPPPPPPGPCGTEKSVVLRRLISVVAPVGLEETKPFLVHICQSNAPPVAFHGIYIRWKLRKKGKHVRSNLCYLICSRHLIISRGVTNRITKRPTFNIHSCARHMFWVTIL